MANIAETLNELGIKDWTLTGEPTTEAQFKKSFKKVTGEDKTGSAILSDDESKFGVTWSQIKAKVSAKFIDSACILLNAISSSCTYSKTM